MKIKFFVFLFFFISVFSYAEAVENEKVIAYYFHTTHRCPTCLKNEDTAKEVIEKYFPEEIQTKKIIFKSLDIELPENKHFVSDYQIFSSCLIFSYLKDGKELKWKNLEKIWIKIKKDEEFEKYIKEELEKFLEENK